MTLVHTKLRSGFPTHGSDQRCRRISKVEKVEKVSCLSLWITVESLYTTAISEHSAVIGRHINCVRITWNEAAARQHDHLAISYLALPYLTLLCTKIRSGGSSTDVVADNTSTSPKGGCSTNQSCTCTSPCFALVGLHPSNNASGP